MLSPAFALCLAPRTAPTQLSGCLESSGPSPTTPRPSSTMKRFGSTTLKTCRSARWPDGWGSARPSLTRSSRHEDWTRTWRLSRPPLPEPGPVVAAIVTSHLGVLVGKRQDGTPRWTFIAGKIEPGESPADAAVREVKEETGLRIEAGRVIGRRVHPVTGRTMVYMAAHPTHGTEVFVGDEEELTEVRWVSLSEAEKLMNGMIFEPVQKYLKQALGSGNAGRGR